MTAKAKKLLVVAPSWVGDMMMAQSLYKVLAKDGYQVDVAAPATTLPLLRYMPEVSQVWQLPFVSGRLDIKQRWAYARRLHQQNYDQAIVLPNSWKSALLPFFAGIEKRSGWLGECRYGLLNDHRRLDKEKLPLMVQRFVALANNESGNDGLLAPSCTVSDLNQAKLLPQLQLIDGDVKSVIDKFNLNPLQSIVSLCPGAAFGPSKRWPADYFAVVAAAMVKQGFQIVLFGSASDHSIAEQIQQASDTVCVNLVGKTSLAEAVAALSLSRVVLSNDSGLMHIACALQLPVVALFGSSSPKFTPPLSETVDIHYLNLACSPCFDRHCRLKHHRCMRDLNPDHVIAVLNKKLLSVNH